MSKNKLVLIKERYELTPSGNGDGVVYLEAPVAVFGEKNNNNRVYEESNYLPLLEELNDKIKTNNLTGELDHPGERLEVFLSNVSHKIEELTYDKGARMVKAKIRLIEGTTAGNNAIALHKAGVKLGISSRAIGVVKENKAILKKIITFDIVSTPGFKSAMLESINESVEFESPSKDYAIYEITDEKYINKYNYLLNEDTNMSDTQIKQDLELLKESLNQIQESIKTINQKFVEFDDNNKKIVADLKTSVNLLESDSEYSKFKQLITEINEKFETFEQYNESHVIALNEFAAKAMENQSDYVNFKNKFIAYNEAETLKLQNLKESVEIIDESMGMFVQTYESYTEKHSGLLNQFVDHQETETNKLNMFVEHQTLESSKLNEMIKHYDNQFEKMNQFVEHYDNQTEKLNQFVEHQEVETNKLNKIVEFLDLNAQKMNNLVEHESQNSDTLNTFVKYCEDNFKDLYEKAEFKTFINKQSNLSVDLTKITESVDHVLNSVRKQKTFRDTVLEKYAFLQCLNEDKQHEFLSLDETRKTMISSAINEMATYDADSILTIWTNVNESTKDKQIVWLMNAKQEYQKLWESLTHLQKTNIIRLASMREFRSQTDIDRFWNGLQMNKQLQVIKENVNLNDFDAEKALNEVKQISQDWKLGYSQDYINKVKDLIKKNK